MMCSGVQCSIFLSSSLREPCRRCSDRIRMSNWSAGSGPRTSTVKLDEQRYEGARRGTDANKVILTNSDSGLQDSLPFKSLNIFLVLPTVPRLALVWFIKKQTKPIPIWKLNSFIDAHIHPINIPHVKLSTCFLWTCNTLLPPHRGVPWGDTE